MSPKSDANRNCSDSCTRASAPFNRSKRIYRADSSAAVAGEFARAKLKIVACRNQFVWLRAYRKERRNSSDEARHQGVDTPDANSPPRPTLLLLMELLAISGAEPSAPGTEQNEAEFSAALITSIRSHDQVSNFNLNPRFLSPKG